MACCVIGYAAKFFAAIGAINWGLVAFYKFNLVEYLDTLTGNKGLDVAVYGIVTVAGIYLLVHCIYKIFKGCGQNCACSGK